jgi:hypothetical protein
MKIGITFDDLVRKRVYTLGKYDFYTREVEVPDDLVAVINNLENLNGAVQRALESLYTTNGKHIMPTDKEILACLRVVRVEAEAGDSAVARKLSQMDSAARSRAKSRQTSVVEASPTDTKAEPSS